MSRLSKSQVIRRYYLYRATARPGFHYAIYTFFLLFNGLSYTQIGLIASIQSIVVVASEVPTGYVGDRIGRRNSLAVGAAILLVSNASYLVATDLIGFTFTFVTLSFGGTFISGSASAWLYDTLQEHDSADEFTRISGRGRAIGLYVGAVGVVLGAVLYTVDRSYPFVAGIVTAALAAAFVLRLPQNEAYDDSAAVEQDRMSVADALPVITDQLTTPRLRWFVVYVSLISGTIWTMDMWIQPIARDAIEATFLPLLQSLPLPQPAVLFVGGLYGAFRLLSAVTSDYAGDLEGLLGVRTSLIVVPAAIATTYVLAGLVPWVVFPMFFALKGGGSLLRPIQNRYLNDNVASVGRATLLSAVAMLRQVVGAPFRFASGVLADAFSAVDAVAILGGVFLVGAALLWVLRPPVSADYQPPPGE
ncbi:MFS transporter [Halobacterium salinarum]|uniref:MFS transporter n=1 Tax=Halobacterium salinarum TaxID=2242 RepID=UPI0025525771|nr:MFS transporter [Halobacterium salinarum]MDL0130191.1 MFS transporter [Halobacterium salinarum]MDL0133188.1 MFS transporter [Halobacterium salinarum]